MSFTVPVTAVSTFTNNVQLALQQKTSKLAPYAMQQSLTGKLVEVQNLVGSSLPQRATTRFGATKYNDTPHTRRWVGKTPEYYFAEPVDTADQLMAVIGLEGSYTTAAAATIARSRDMAWLEGFYGTAQTGETGATLVGFAAANIVAVDVGAAAATGLNIAKLRAAQKVLRTNLVDLDSEEAWMVVTAEQVEDLQSQVEVQSSDFNKVDGPGFNRDGKLTKLLGFNFIEMQYGDAAVVGDDIAAITLQSAGVRRVPFWVKSGMCVNTWDPMRMFIDRLPGNQQMTQVWAGTTLAATRTEEGKCGQVLCQE